MALVLFHMFHVNPPRLDISIDFVAEPVDDSVYIVWSSPPRLELYCRLKGFLLRMEEEEVKSWCLFCM